MVTGRNLTLGPYPAKVASLPDTRKEGQLVAGIPPRMGQTEDSSSNRRRKDSFFLISSKKVS